MKTRSKQILATALAVVSLAVSGPPNARPAPTAAACAAKPTVVLVHGAWAGTSSWNGETERLQQEGYKVRAFANPLRGLISDAAGLAAFLKTIDGPIVLVGHSYGGSVITNAAAGNPNVEQLVYVDAAAPAVGESTGQLSGKTSALGGPPDTLYDRVSSPGAASGDVLLYLKQPVFLQSFGPDLPKPAATTLWAGQRPAAMSAFTTPSKAAAWKTIPSWYVIGTADKIITPESQQAMAERANAKILRVPGGSHLTLISHPEAVTDQILAAAHATCPAT
ncbi:alpha/beta hydrolase [Dactylosporangium siamense]|uniref:Alpha/beta hydrolase n=1 Tax=Dactylosporangium siamense TaxID=685454 RepID=A0A919U795_9ACTN|nr:alpha/beta hydrolase [Dactylosporangium siamense]GIG45309.1 alpha/beta hydrolase [Dactylosporangium siamense]